MKSTSISDNSYPLPLVYTLSAAERMEIEKLLSEMTKRYSTIERDDVALACEIASSKLPHDLLNVLRSIASGYTKSSHLLIKGFEVDDTRIGDSPLHWDAPWDSVNYLREEMFQMLVSSAIGGVFGWRTQENGRFLRHIVPIEAVKNEQLGGSSATTLLWHKEEAFHPGRADFFTLMCYRNSERATTNISCVDDIEISPEDYTILHQERFLIKSDKSHTPVENNSEYWKMNSEAFSIIQDMMDNPQPVALLYGGPRLKMMRVDQAFACSLPGDEEANRALNALHDALDTAAIHLVMEPGDIVLLDNLRVAHGRSIYKPNYGPKQRWMRRVNIASGRRANFRLRDSHKLRVML
ncbi:MAG: TauD/TfdA family dioxygenase [Lautropia sp.]|nr:TauD/TfdA family dioxygenase [Lautropia sp.]